MRHPATRRETAWTLGLVGVFGVVGSGCTSDVEDTWFRQATVDLIEERSSAYTAQIGDGIGWILKGRYLGDGRFVLILDRHSPHLRLFTSEGDSLWAGGFSGEGPGELVQPDRLATSLAARGEEVFVAQRGRISLWRLAGDSLAFQGSVPLDPLLTPQDAYAGCDGDWIVYGRDDSQLSLPPDDTPWMSIQGSRTDFLHRVEVGDEGVRVEPLWHDHPITIGAAEANLGSLVSRQGDHVVVHHRPNWRGAGDLLEFDCAGNLLRSHSEQALAAGDPFPVLLPRPRPPEWVSGAVALPDGFVLAMHRPFSPRVHGVDEYHTHTEFFVLQDGSYQGSVVVPGMRGLLDHHPESGILIRDNINLPHFITVPLEELLGEMREGAVAP